MNRIGARLSDFGKFEHPKELFTKVLAHGYNCGQLVLFKSFNEIDSYQSAVSDSIVCSISESMADNDFTIPVLGCYHDLQDRSQRKIILENFERYCAIAAKLKASCIGTESSFALKENFDKDTINYVLKITEELNNIAFKHDVCLGLEFCAYHPYSDIKVFEKILSSVSHPEYLRLIFDPANILADSMLAKQHEVMKLWVSKYRHLICAVHAKNFKFNEQGKRVRTSLKEGLVDFAYIAKLFEFYDVHAPILREEPYVDNEEIEKDDLEILRTLCNQQLQDTIYIQSRWSLV